MNVTLAAGHDSLARVYVAELDNGRFIEFVESVQPPVPREKKWVLIVSTLAGCPVRCPICDAGGSYKGKLTTAEILAQIDYLIAARYPNRKIPVEKFKIQFARMGDPAFNLNVIDVLEQLPERYDAPGLMPCISTVAPGGAGKFFEMLLEVKRNLYGANFQMQFSIHSTDIGQRNALIPIKKWGFDDIARFGSKFHQNGDRKIALNFALARGSQIDPDTLLRYFNPDKFMIKITPVNPTYSSAINRIESYLNSGSDIMTLTDSLRMAGYEVLVSIGELKENDIGSNCGQYVIKHLKAENKLPNSYRDLDNISTVGQNLTG